LVSFCFISFTNSVLCALPLPCYQSVEATIIVIATIAFSNVAATTDQIINSICQTANAPESLNDRQLQQQHSQRSWIIWQQEKIFTTWLKINYSRRALVSIPFESLLWRNTYCSYFYQGVNDRHKIPFNRRLGCMEHDDGVVESALGTIPCMAVAYCFVFSFEFHWWYGRYTVHMISNVPHYEQYSVLDERQKNWRKRYVWFDMDNDNEHRSRRSAVSLIISTIYFRSLSQCKNALSHLGFVVNWLHRSPSSRLLSPTSITVPTSLLWIVYSHNSDGRRWRTDFSLLSTKDSSN